jgi:hypothetical protein
MMGLKEFERTLLVSMDKWPIRFWNFLKTIPVHDHDFHALAT